MLSLDAVTAAVLAQMTPDPHTSGDQPADTSLLIPLLNLSAPAVVDPGIPALEPFIAALNAIYTNIADNPAARPAYWDENVGTQSHEYRVHLDDNGMLTTQWVFNWGDGSPLQIVNDPNPVLYPNAPLVPWVIHQYATAGDYSIVVTAQTPDGVYSADSTGGTIVDVSGLFGVGIGGGSGGSLQVTLPDQPPTLHVAGPQTAAVGQAFALDNLVSVSDPNAADVPPDNLTNEYNYIVDWGDGTTPFTGNNIEVLAQGGSGSPFLGALSSNTPDGPLTHAFSDPGTYNIAVTVTDSTGLSDTQTIPITVDALSAAIGGLPSGKTCNERSTVNLIASISPTPADPVAYAWQIADSEGNIVAQRTDPTLNYTFAYADTYTVSLVATVDNVSSAPATTAITVNNVAPSVSWVAGTTPAITASVGQTVSLPPISFTDENPSDTHTVTVDWGDGSPLDTNAQVTEETTSGLTVVPGTITDSYAYTTATPTGTPDQVTITPTDSEGLPATPLTFYVNVVSAAVTLTDFAPSSDGSKLNVSYTVTGAAAAGPFHIDIYTSPDGSTPDQLLQSVAIDGSADLPLTSGTASFTPQFDDIQSNYHLIAVADANGATSGIEFDGGIFYAQSVTASPPQNILYVFGSNSSDLPGSGEDTVNIYGAGDSPANSVVFDGDSAFDYSSITPPITGIHVRGEAGNDEFQADANVTLPLWLYGGSGANTLVGGGGNNVIVGGSGTNVIHDGNGQSSPQIVDSSDTLTAFSGLSNYYHELGTWTNDSTPGTAYNGGQRLHAAGAGDTAKWTFANLDATAYYDVYVTWSPEADASTTADYSVNNGGGAMDPIGQSGVAPVNQTQAPYDVQSAGVSWQDLGVFQAGSGTLNVQLASGASSPVLANAVMIVPYATVPLTNLTMGSFTVDSQGNLSVRYTINGEDAPPFNIGIYGSPDGRQATNLLQMYPITDPNLLGGGGQSYTVTFPAALDSLTSSEYVIAQLDSSDAVEETSKADNISAPLSGIFEQGDGTLVVLGNASFLANNNISLRQDLVTGNVTVITADAEGDPLTSSTFSGVASVIVSTPGGNNTVNVDPSVTVPVSAFAGPASNVVGTLAATDATPSITVISFPPTIDKGGIATLTANVGNLGGLGFTVTIEWGYYEGSDTIVYPPDTTSFTMTHHYVDDGAALFAIDFPVTVNVISTDGQTGATSTSTMGQDVLPAINIAGGTGSIMAGNPVDLSAVVADTGEFGTFTYEWTATGGGDSFSSTSAIFDFTPTNNADHRISLDVIGRARYIQLQQHGGPSADNLAVVVTRVRHVIRQGQSVGISKMLRTVPSVFRRGCEIVLGPMQAAPPQTRPYRLTPRHGVLALLAAEAILLLLEGCGLVPDGWKEPVFVAGMAVTAVAVLTWLRLTPRHVVLALLAVEMLMLLSEHIRTNPVNDYKGWAVLGALEVLAAALAFLLLWFFLALFFSLRFQFSIGSLLLFAVAAALPFSWLAKEMEQARRQKQIVETITQNGGKVEYDCWRTDMPISLRLARGGLLRLPPPSYWQDLLGVDFFADAVVVKVRGDVDLRSLEGLSHVAMLSFDHATDEGLEAVGRLTSLESLAFGGNVTNAGLTHIKGLTKLESLHITSTRVTEAGLVHLEGLTNLKSFSLNNAAFPDAGFVRRKGLTRLGGHQSN
jgi:hypothetical protein